MDGDGDLMAIVRSCAKTMEKDKSNTTLVQSTNCTSVSPPSPPPPAPPLSNLITSNQENTTINADYFPKFSLGNTNFDMALNLESVSQQPLHQHLSVADIVAQIMDIQGKSRRMKSVSKKVKEVEVPVWRGHNNDHWSWRKYGQKTLKGTPYPRNYYRCSSSKECPAKKYVEKSISDPMTNVIIYVEKHNHPIPSTQRSALHASSSSSMSATSPQTDQNQ